MQLLDYLQKRCDERRLNHQYRQPVCLSHTTAPSTQMNDKKARLFCSNNYLGLANHPDIIHAFTEGAQRYGVGSGASPLVSGYSEAHRDTEEAYADFIGAEDAMLCSSGFAANMAAIQSLVMRGNHVVHDKDNHASLLDATIASRAHLHRYPHLDSKACGELLRKHSQAGVLLVSDSVFSMSGDQADIPELLLLTKKHDATLMVDDSHGFGVLGQDGRGCVSEYDVSPSEVSVITVGLGKAMGCSGGLIVGSRDMIAGLRQFGRSYVYSTAIPAAMALAAKKSLALLQEESWRVVALHDLIGYFKEKAHQIGLSCLPSNTAIQSWVVGPEEKAVLMAEALQNRGFLLIPIRTPTVPSGKARLRITLNVGQSKEDIDALMVAISEVRDACA